MCRSGKSGLNGIVAARLRPPTVPIHPICGAQSIRTQVNSGQQVRALREASVPNVAAAEPRPWFDATYCELPTADQLLEGLRTLLAAIEVGENSRTKLQNVLADSTAAKDDTRFTFDAF
jgi:hypothetical protein